MPSRLLAGQGASGWVRYENDTDVLDRELQRVLAVFDSVTDDEWARPTLLVPWDAGQPHWTVFELAGHFDISIGLTRMLIADPSNGQPGRDRVSFFIFPRSEVAPGVYDYAYTMVEGRSRATCPVRSARRSRRRSRNHEPTRRRWWDPGTTH